jgi:hypothetical protein
MTDAGGVPPRPRPDRPILVTTAGKSPGEERRERERRYLVTMGIRVACFILAIVLVALDLRWEAGIAVAASLILPWVAVIAANAGPKRGEPERPQLHEEPNRREVGPGG